MAEVGGSKILSCFSLQLFSVGFLNSGEGMRPSIPFWSESKQERKKDHHVKRKPIGSMGLIYLPTCFVNVGKYTSPMDPMGRGPREVADLRLIRLAENVKLGSRGRNPEDPWDWHIYLHLP